MALIFKAEEDTPYVKLSEDGKISIEGRSMPENVTVFYDPIIDWVKEYAKNPSEVTEVFVFLYYTNSCSFKSINTLLKELKKSEDKTKIEVVWYYEEDDQSMKETGEDMQSLVGLPFTFHAEPVKKLTNKRLKVRNTITGKISRITQRYWDLIVRNGHKKDFEVLEDPNNQEF